MNVFGEDEVDVLAELEPVGLGRVLFVLVQAFEEVILLDREFDPA